jgi:hypothetical protein
MCFSRYRNIKKDQKLLNMDLPTLRPRTLIILVALLGVVLLSAWTAYQFDQAAAQSERHDYSYLLELSYNTTIHNVTFLLPVPELDHTPFFMGSILNGTAYGIPPDWHCSLVRENGTPMLAITAARMVPVYNGYPIAIEPGTSVLPTTLVPGHEYSADTPVLVPVTIVVMEPVDGEINTSYPSGSEPLFFPEGMFTPGSCTLPCAGRVYDHRVPVYIGYTAEHPVSLSLRVSVTGTNAAWRGGWTSHSYADTVVIETVNNGTQGWIAGEGQLFTTMKAERIG